MSWRKTTRSHPYELRNRVVTITRHIVHAPAIPALPQPVVPQPVAPQPVAPQPVAPQPVAAQPVAPQLVAPQLPLLDHNAVQAVPQSLFGGAIANNNNHAGGIGAIQAGTANAGNSNTQAVTQVIPERPSLTGCPPEVRRLIFEFVFGRWEYVEARDALPLLLTSRLFRREAGRLAFQYVHFPLGARWSLNLANPAIRQARLNEINNALGHPGDAQRLIVQRFSAEHNGPLDAIHFLVPDIESSQLQINIRPQGPGALDPFDAEQNAEDIQDMITRVSHHTVTNARLTTLTIHFWGNQWDLFERLVGPDYLRPEWSYPLYRFELARQPTRRPELVHNQRLLLHFRATPDAAAQGFRDFDVYFAREPRPPTSTHTDGTGDDEPGPGNEIVPNGEPAPEGEVIPDHELDPDNAIVPDRSSNPASGMITNGEPDLDDHVVPDGEHDPANIITGSSESEANLGHHDPQLSAFELHWINFGRETDTAEEAPPDAQNGPETIGVEGGQEEPDMEDEAGDLEMEDDAEDLEMEDEDEDLYS